MGMWVTKQHRCSATPVTANDANYALQSIHLLLQNYYSDSKKALKIHSPTAIRKELQVYKSLHNTHIHVFIFTVKH